MPRHTAVSPVHDFNNFRREAQIWFNLILSLYWWRVYWFWLCSAFIGHAVTGFVISSPSSLSSLLYTITRFLFFEEPPDSDSVLTPLPKAFELWAVAWSSSVAKLSGSILRFARFSKKPSLTYQIAVNLTGQIAANFLI